MVSLSQTPSYHLKMHLNPRLARSAQFLYATVFQEQAIPSHSSCTTTRLGHIMKLKKFKETEKKRIIRDDGGVRLMLTGH